MERRQKSPLSIFFKGDNCAAVHLRARTGNGNNRSERDSLYREFSFHIFQLPQIFRQHGLGGNRFAAVNHASSAGGQNEIHLLFPDKRCTFLHFCVSWIRRDTGKLHNVFSCLHKQPTDFIVDTVLFYRTSPICQHNRITGMGKLYQKRFLCTPFAEIDFCRIRICELIHCDTSSFHLTKFVNTFSFSG